MRKLIQMLVIACMVVLGTQVAFANYDNETVVEGADLASIDRIAIGAPLYQIVDQDAPSKDMLKKIIYDASRVTRTQVVSYDDVAANIRSTKGVDVAVIDRHKAAKLFKECVPELADAYVILTVANHSRTSFFFDVYKTGTNELLYTYEIRANKSEENSVRTYKNFCEQFYRHFDRAVDKQIKKKFSDKK